jgi:hypothetical protein
MKIQVVAAMLFLGACGGGDKLTLRATCEALATATCDRSADCFADVPSDCVSQIVQACCTGSSCDAEIEDSGAADQLDECVDDIGTLSCADLEEGTLPASCN